MKYILLALAAVIGGAAVYAGLRRRKPTPRRRTIADEIADYKAHPPKPGDLFYDMVTALIEKGIPLEFHTGGR